MDAIECIVTRASVRKFRPDPVPDEEIREIVRAAQWTPSYKNSQLWQVLAANEEHCA